MHISHKFYPTSSQYKITREAIIEWPHAPDVTERVPLLKVLELQLTTNDTRYVFDIYDLCLMHWMSGQNCFTYETKCTSIL